MKNVLVIICMLSSFALTQTNSTEISGREVYEKVCIKCHGKSGDISAFSLSRKFYDMSKKEMEERLRLFATDRSMQNGSGVSAVMGKQAGKLSRQEIEAVLGYISNFAGDSNEN